MELSRKASPIHALNFRVEFDQLELPTNGLASDARGQGTVALCGGSFAEITGLEATMEPRVIKQGGQNFGEIQRVGPVTFAPVIFKRGVTTIQDLWRWFELVGGGMYAKRLTARVIMLDAARNARHTFVLERALPVKFKAADFNAQSTAVAIEELHIVHEGMSMVRPSGGGQTAPAAAPNQPGPPR